MPKKKVKLYKQKDYTRITNNKSTFLKSLSFEQIKCPDNIFEQINYTNSEFPIINNTTTLKEVIVEKKRVLNYEKQSGNQFAKAIKINPKTDNRSLLQIIAYNGFRVIENEGNTQILNFGRPKINGEPTIPMIYLNDYIVTDLKILAGLTAQQVDEIYINKDDISISRYEEVGTIRIYTRKGANIDNKDPNFRKIKIVDAFQYQKKFTNPYQYNLQSKSFKTHGVINWLPNVSTDSSGYFEIRIPKMEQNEVLINIQGIDNIGNLIFENSTLEF